MFPRAFRHSAVGTLVTNVRKRLGTAISESRLRKAIPRRPFRGSNDAESEARNGREAVLKHSAIVSAIRTSRVGKTVGSLPAFFQTASTHSRLSNLATAGRRYVMGSWLYRWLTAEPDPDVVVIDLRETMTVGPWLAALERGMRWLLPAVATSVLIRSGKRSHRLVTARPIQLLSLFVGAVAAGVVLFSAVTDSVSMPAILLAIVLSLLALVGSQITWTWEQVQETRGYQALASAFEPPEPPERIHERDNQRETTDTDEK